MKGALAVLTCVAALLQARCEVAGAHTSPPPPPSATPTCGYCGGPPPPPAIVPTAPPTVVPKVGGAAKRSGSTSVYKAEVTPTKVRRGGAIKIVVKATKGEPLQLSLQYQHRKPTLYKGKADRAGVYQQSIKVSTSAPLGKASIKVSFLPGGAAGGAIDPMTVAFTVIK